ncbi:prolyl oligopeptidase family serine peptidase [candidate division KSB1 bacterium]|nr:prolyl oligopeptidase family serine peptidase [candidate division KSB1 bacterium]
MNIKPHLIFGLLILFVLFLTNQSYSQKKLTISDIYGDDAKFGGESLSNVKWVPGKQQFSYTETNDGVKSLRIYDIRSKKRQKIFDSQQVPEFKTLERERRIIPDSYFWSPSGESALINSGTDLFLYEIGREQLQQLTNDDIPRRDPTFSPDEKKIAYIKNQNLYVLDIDSKTETRLTTEGSEHILIGRFDYVYEEEFDLRTGFFWSPNSKHIAFYWLDESVEPVMPFVNYMPLHNTVRYIPYAKPGDHNAIVKIAVVSLADGNITWMDIGEEIDIYIPRVKWLPNSERLAIYRMNRRQSKLELLFTDIQSGASKVVLTETEDHGWLDVHDDLRFLQKANAFTWSSDRSGFNHLYLYDYSGRMLHQLTNGDWGVRKLVGLDASANRIYFTANRESIFESHLYSISMGSGINKLTSESGMHSINMHPDASHYLDTFSDLKTPPKVRLFSQNGKLVDTIVADKIDALSEYHLTMPEFVKVPAEDGTLLNAAVTKPADFDPSKKYPVLFTIYGGPGSQTIRNDWGGSGYLWRQLMTQKGFIIFQLDNRGTGGRGAKFKKQMYRRFGHFEVVDMVNGVEYLRTLPYVDAERIGIYGWSYGGYTTIMNMLKASDQFKAGVAVAPVTDWRNYDSIYTERYMDTPQNNPDGYRESNALNYAAGLRGKLLLVHGIADDNVHMSHTMQLARELQQLDKQFDMMIYPEKDHSIRKVRSHLFQKITDFFIENL